MAGKAHTAKNILTSDLRVIKAPGSVRHISRTIGAPAARQYLAKKAASAGMGGIAKKAGKALIKGGILTDVAIEGMGIAEDIHRTRRLAKEGKSIKASDLSSDTFKIYHGAKAIPQIAKARGQQYKAERATEETWRQIQNKYPEITLEHRLRSSKPKIKKM